LLRAKQDGDNCRNHPTRICQAFNR
jgi:hypothetical protein